MKKQSSNRVFMIRPHHFGYNVETESNNKFQKRLTGLSEEAISKQALDEFDRMVLKLRKMGVFVDVFEDLPDPILPDSVFPNNWISTTHEGVIYTYPMYAPVRRLERREDIINYLSAHYRVEKRFSLEMFEEQDQFLEGTGSLILDHLHQIAYACLSPRTDARLLDKFALLSNYRSFFFKAADAQKNEIYHTNVMMAMGQDFVVCCLDAIANELRSAVLDSFNHTGKRVVDIGFEQMEHFAGNMLLVENLQSEPFLVCSERAYNSLDINQKTSLERSSSFLVVDLDIIETIGGGSARCMIAENFLEPK